MSSAVQYIGVAGTAGAGKDTVADMIARLFGATNLSSSDAIRAVTRHVYHLPPDNQPDRPQLFEVATFLREHIDPAFAVKVCMLEAAVQEVKIAVISGLRTMGEAVAIRDAGGVIIGVDADPGIRYGRIYTRGRDSGAQKSYDEFLAQDTYENKGVAEKGPLQGIRAIIDTADMRIGNEATIDELEADIIKQLTPLLSP